MAPTVVGSGGDSASWRQYQATARGSFEKFRQSSEETRSLPFDDLRAEQLCRREVWEAYVDFIFAGYIQEGGRNAGKPLALGTSLGYLGAMLNLAQGRFAAGGAAEITLFFTCLDPQSHSPHARWMKGLRTNLVRKAFERSKVNGEEMDQSAAPICLAQVQEVNRCYALEGSSEVRAARRLKQRTRPRAPPFRLPAHLPRRPRAGRGVEVRRYCALEHRRPLGRTGVDPRRRSGIRLAERVHRRRGAADQGIQAQAFTLGPRHQPPLLRLTRLCGESVRPPHRRPYSFCSHAPPNYIYIHTYIHIYR